MEEDFVAFYMEATKFRPKMAINDLMQLGFGPDLELVRPFSAPSGHQVKNYVTWLTARTAAVAFVGYLPQQTYRGKARAVLGLHPVACNEEEIELEGDIMLSSDAADDMEGASMSQRPSHGHRGIFSTIGDSDSESENA